MLTILQEYYKRYGKSPSKREIPEHEKIIWKYGSWNAALYAAGLPVNRKFVHTEEELIASLHRFYNENGKSPIANDCNRVHYLFDTRTYMNKLKCKTWAQVLRKAGLQEYFEFSPFTELPDDQILLLVKTLLNAGGITTQAYYNRNKGNLPSLHFLKSKFGTWNQILKRIDIVPNLKAFTDEDLIDLYFEVKDYCGKIPSCTAFYLYSGVNYDVYKHRFGSWGKFLDSIGEKKQK